MSRYKPYSAYREAGVEWIGVVPGHWTTLRLADIGPLAKGNDGTKENDADSGMTCVRYGDLYTTYDFLIHEIKKFICPESTLFVRAKVSFRRAL
jgi:type I restriction enzyme, S subunit